MHNYREPASQICGSIAPIGRRPRCRPSAENRSGQDIPHLTAAIIAKYISNLRPLVTLL